VRWQDERCLEERAVRKARGVHEGSSCRGKQETVRGKVVAVYTEVVRVPRVRHIFATFARCCGSGEFVTFSARVYAVGSRARAASYEARKEDGVCVAVDA